MARGSVGAWASAAVGATPSVGIGDDELHAVKEVRGGGLAVARGATSPVGEALSSGAALSGSFSLKRGGGADALLDGSFTPMRGRGDELVGHVFLGTDVTQAETAMADAEARREAMEAAQTKVVEMLRVNLSKLSEGDLTSVIDERMMCQSTVWPSV